MKYFALARQEVVLNVEPVHGFKMALKNGHGNQVSNRCYLVIPFLNRVQRSSARLQVRFILFIPLRNTRIQIPAYVIKTGRSSERLDFSARLLLDMQESHHHVRNLYAGVVDVVLDIDFPARKAQQADERISKNRIPQVPPMRRLVGIDAGMLDQHFARWNRGRGLFVRNERRGQLGAVHSDVDVPSARNLEFLKARNRVDSGANLFLNLAQCLAKFPGKFESY